MKYYVGIDTCGCIMAATVAEDEREREKHISEMWCAGLVVKVVDSNRGIRMGHYCDGLPDASGIHDYEDYVDGTSLP